jgi:cytochrome c
MRRFANLTSLLWLVSIISISPVHAADQDAEATMAKSLLDKAVNLIRDKGPIAAFYQFNTDRDQFVNGEFYVWVISMDGVIFAHSSNPNMVGLAIKEAQDLSPAPESKQSAKELVEYAAAHDEGDLDYVWFNPVDHQYETKHSFFKRISPSDYFVDFIVLTGYFEPAKT